MTGPCQHTIPPLLPTNYSPSPGSSTPAPAGSKRPICQSGQFQLNKAGVRGRPCPSGATGGRGRCWRPGQAPELGLGNFAVSPAGPRGPCHPATRPRVPESRSSASSSAGRGRAPGSRWEAVMHPGTCVPQEASGHRPAGSAPARASRDLEKTW